ncbi:hypothetical protein [Gordonia soli]|uniref:SnoaL-like domain-containing protein n=1 Tax=Gordonia soli NBRC 108243 TaxID=1223545 RepID=M0QMV0_9ACTN|nr:hypothetical protein [Gordonia soli]GAC69878.1 hypothetical protein GS4_28_01260 [Gordonia soli NBRC 108243]
MSDSGRSATENGTTENAVTENKVTDSAATDDLRGAVAGFFDIYGRALLARDEAAVAQLYAVPSLILFPGQSIAVSDARQTEEFFASNWEQYEGVQEAIPDIRLLGVAPETVWADVTWTFGGSVREHFCYQLVARDRGFQIAVLTLMG